MGGIGEQREDRVGLFLPSARVHLVKVTPKIFSVAFEILQRTGMRSTRCQHTEANDQGNSEHGHRFNKVISDISLTRFSFEVRGGKRFVPGRNYWRSMLPSV